MTADITGRVLCDFIENDPTTRSGGRICYESRRAGTEVEGWTKVGKFHLCPYHSQSEVAPKSGKSWRQS